MNVFTVLRPEKYFFFMECIRNSHLLIDFFIPFFLTVYWFFFLQWLSICKVTCVEIIFQICTFTKGWIYLFIFKNLVFNFFLGDVLWVDRKNNICDKITCLSVVFSISTNKHTHAHFGFAFDVHTDIFHCCLHTEINVCP